MSMKISGAKAGYFAQLATNRILDKGLAMSTFRDKFPEAYYELVKYHRADIEADIRAILEGR